MIFPDSDGPGSLDDFKLSTAVISWDYLRPHFERGALIFVDPGIPLETVAAAISADAHAQVKDWLNQGDLVKIQELHAAQWRDSVGDCFEALVVSPFVLFRPVGG